jgi:hypothetical protein
MTDKLLRALMMSLLLASVAIPATPAGAQVCAPLDDGRIADAFHEGTVIFWDPVVEFQRITLTISGPCEDIVKVFTPKDEILFDIREIERITDGQYTWTLRRDASIDPDVQQRLAESRGSGEEDQLWWSYFQQGKIPEGPYTESGSFTVDRGQIVDPGQVEKTAVVGKARGGSSDLAGATVLGGVRGGEAAKTGGNTLATRDQVIPDDLIVQSSLCVGFDCVNNESFSFDTIRLKENNLRIHFQDTSVGAFPTGDWRLEANSSASGGLSYFAIQDADSGSNIVLVEDGAPTDSVRVDSTGRVGLGTANPVLDLHISSTNTPGMRLEQTSAGGFTAQTWDIAGNEANFFVRDVTGGSRLPFRIRPGAPTSSIDISAAGAVGIGTASPAQDFHVTDRGDANTNTAIRISTSSHAWDFATIESNGNFRISKDGTGNTEFDMTAGGDLTITGELTTGGTTCGGGGCDLVFSPDTDRTPLEAHAAAMWSQGYLPAVGPTPENQPFNLTEKVGGILHELEMAHIYIEQLSNEKRALEERLSQVEALLGTVLDAQD